MHKGCYAVLLASLWLTGCDSSETAPPTVAPTTTALADSSAPAAADELAGQQLCSDPLNAFLDDLDRIEPGTQIAADRLRFGQLIDACKRAYQAELTLLEQSFAELPADSQCRQKEREYRREVGLFDEISADFQSLPHEVFEQPETYQEHFTILATGLMIQLTMVTMHRVGHCQTEYALQY